MQTKLKLRTATKQVPRGGKPSEPVIARQLPAERPPTHPGAMLLEEFLKPLRTSQAAFAERLGISFPRLNEIIRAKRGVTTDTALRLARVLGMSADFWLGLQQDWDLWHAVRSEKAAAITRLEPLHRAGGAAAHLCVNLHEADLASDPTRDVGKYDRSTRLYVKPM